MGLLGKPIAALVMAGCAVIIALWQEVIAHRDANRNRETNRSVAEGLIATRQMSIIRAGVGENIAPPSPNLPSLASRVLGGFAVVVPLGYSVLEYLGKKEPESLWWWTLTLSTIAFITAAGGILCLRANRWAAQFPPAQVERLDGVGGTEIVLLPDEPLDAAVPDAKTAAAPDPVT
jgi:hypothetical protein